VRIVRHLAGTPPIATVSLEHQGRRYPLRVDIAVLLALSETDRADRFSRALASGGQQSNLDGQPLAPVDGNTEVWAAGVTYQRSRHARMAESERSADIYARVYDAVRPELFFKSTAWRVAGPGEPIAVRPDSEINVPEPELAVVLDSTANVVGFTVCNDVSSRSIEGENPLYLPQAKVYLGACALGPAIVTVDDIPDPLTLPITLEIERANTTAWRGAANTAQLHRRLDNLIDHLFRADEFPWGVILATGTCLVPDLPFTLIPGDVVRIGIGEIGILENHVVGGKHEVLASRPFMPAVPAVPAGLRLPLEIATESVSVPSRRGLEHR
jgi:2-dehydro-3-deoxy-D-arabinonate dehydratase